MQPAIRMLAFAVLLAGVGCSATRPAPGAANRPSSAFGGALRVSLRAPAEATGDTDYMIAGAWAISDGGDEFPLSIVRPDALSRPATWERLLAETSLPPGRYAGLRFTVRDDSGRGRTNRAVDRDAAAPSAWDASAPVSFAVPDLGTALVRVEVSGRPRTEWIEDGGAPIRIQATVPSPPAEGLIGIAVCEGDRAAYMFDKITGETFAVVPTGRSPVSVALDTRRRRAFVGVTGADAIEVLGFQETAVIERIPLAAGDRPSDLAITENGKLLIAVNSGSDSLAIFETAALTEVTRLRLSYGATRVMLDPDGTRAWVLETASDSVAVIDLARGVVLTRLGVDPEPVRAAFSRDGSRLYLAHPTTPNVTVIDTETFETERVYVGTGTSAIAVDPQSDQILVARRGMGVIAIYDPSTLLSVDEFSTGGAVDDITIGFETNILYLTRTSRGRIDLVRLNGRRVAAEIDVGRRPARIAVVAER